MVSCLPGWLISISSKYKIPNCKFGNIFEVKNCKKSDMGGLSWLFKIKTDTRVMTTTNIDIPDTLMNKKLGTAKYIAANQN